MMNDPSLNVSNRIPLSAALNDAVGHRGEEHPSRGAHAAADRVQRRADRDVPAAVPLRVRRFDRHPRA